jgi:hypothetical protein
VRPGPFARSWRVSGSLRVAAEEGGACAERDDAHAG